MNNIEKIEWIETNSMSKRLIDFNKKKKKVDNPICTGCNCPIDDKYLFSLNNKYWHKSCTLCSICENALEESCFMLKDNQLFCRNHYYKSSFATTCSGCNLPMQTHEVAMRALSRFYHVTCFACSCCHHLLQSGDEFILYGPESLLVCREDYENGAHLHCCSAVQIGDYDYHQIVVKRDSNELSVKDDCNDSCMVVPDRLGNYNWTDDLSGGNNCNDVCSYDYRSTLLSSKRPRTTLTIEQKRRLTLFFRTCPNPNVKERQILAEETKLPLKVIQVWFQNQRAKVRQFQKINSEISTDYYPFSNSVEMP